MRNMHRRGSTRVPRSKKRCRCPLSSHQRPARSLSRPQLASPPLLQPSGSATAVHVTRPAMPALHFCSCACLCGLAVQHVIRRSSGRLRGMLQPLVMISAAMMATWGAAQASIHRALAATLPPAPLASITGSYPLILEEFNRWVVYTMQKVPPPETTHPSNWSHMRMDQKLQCLSPHHIAIVVQFFSQGILAKIAAVAAFAVPLVLFFGYLYRRTSGKSMDDSMFQVYSILQDTPGATSRTQN